MNCPKKKKRPLAAGESSYCDGEVFFVQDTREYHSFMLPTDENASEGVDLIEVCDSQPSGNFHLWCEGCGTKWDTVKAFRKTLGAREREKHEEPEPTEEI